ncbi:hypothetical protein [Vibrio sp. St2]|uniref:hypothetical protein n=1 Tax=Vibrio sp. St2 TaxID=2853441 RepID=UPI00248E8264|nr:hypothetical protein [Vibrio sp. St2]
MENQIVSIAIATVGTIAACIAAIPIVKSWLPLRLLNTEKELLSLSLKNENYPGIIQYYLEPIGGRTKPHANAPYSPDHVEVKFEILELREKGLIDLMDTASTGRSNLMWYQLTTRGYKLAKTLEAKKP